MKRIQRLRTKGWKMPPNTIYVGRPTRWGNPYKVADYTRDGALAEYWSWLDRRTNEDPDFLSPLQAKDLACWCPLNLPCHADLLLEMLARIIPQKPEAKQ